MIVGCSMVRFLFLRYPLPKRSSIIQCRYPKEICGIIIIISRTKQVKQIIDILMDDAKEFNSTVSVSAFRAFLSRSIIHSHSLFVCTVYSIRSLHLGFQIVVSGFFCVSSSMILVPKFARFSAFAKMWRHELDRSKFAGYCDGIRRKHSWICGGNVKGEFYWILLNTNDHVLKKLWKWNHEDLNHRRHDNHRRRYRNHRRRYMIIRVQQYSIKLTLHISPTHTVHNRGACYTN
jgi:hypothetical protein